MWAALIFALSFILWILQKKVRWSQKCVSNLIREMIYLLYTVGFTVAIGAILTRGILYYLQYRSIYSKELGDSLEQVSLFIMQFVVTSNIALRYKLGILVIFFVPAMYYVSALLAAINISTLFPFWYYRALWPSSIEIVFALLWALYLSHGVSRGRIEKEKIDTAKSWFTVLAAIGTMTLLSSTFFDTVGFEPKTNILFKITTMMTLMVIYPFYIALLTSQALMEMRSKCVK